MLIDIESKRNKLSSDILFIIELENDPHSAFEADVEFTFDFEVRKMRDIYSSESIEKGVTSKENASHIEVMDPLFIVKKSDLDKCGIDNIDR